jgi:hypothetical protein
VIAQPGAPLTTSLLVPIILAVFSSAATVALIQGIFSRPKVRADATATLAAVEVSDASVTEIIQRAAAGLVADLERQLADMRRRLSAAEEASERAEQRAEVAERRIDGCDRWRMDLAALLVAHTRWDRQVADLLTRNSIPAPPPPPLTPSAGYPLPLTITEDDHR